MIFGFIFNNGCYQYKRKRLQNGTVGLKLSNRSLVIVARVVCIATMLTCVWWGSAVWLGWGSVAKQMEANIAARRPLTSMVVRLFEPCVRRPVHLPPQPPLLGGQVTVVR